MVRENATFPRLAASVQNPFKTSLFVIRCFLWKRRVSFAVVTRW